MFATKLLIMVMTRSKVKLSDDEWTVDIGQWTRIAGEFNKNSSAADARGRRLTERRRRRMGGGFLTFPPAVSGGIFLTTRRH